MVQVQEPWRAIYQDAEREASSESCLAPLLEETVLRHKGIEEAIIAILAQRMSDAWFPSAAVRCALKEAIVSDNTIGSAMTADLVATFDTDPACRSLLHILLFYKGYHAIQIHRLAHALWIAQREVLARQLHHRATEVFGVDIHPASTFGRGIYADHATGIVVGETAIIGDNVTILQGVTLGARGGGAVDGRRHPRVERGVLLGANCTILGAITIGEDAKIGAGAVVLQDVPAHCTAVGNPATIIRRSASLDCSSTPLVTSNIRAA